MNALERLNKEMGVANMNSRKGVRCNDKYKALLTNLKRLYYREYYKKSTNMRWNDFCNETGLYYSLEKCFKYIKADEYKLLKFVLDNPYEVKYVDWDRI